MSEPRRMAVSRFRQLGLLQELNRQFLHPLGLALEVQVDVANGEERFGGVWDYRDDPVGIHFDNEVLASDRSRAAADYVHVLLHRCGIDRRVLFGQNIQPIPGTLEDIEPCPLVHHTHEDLTRIAVSLEQLLERLKP